VVGFVGAAEVGQMARMLSSWNNISPDVEPPPDPAAIVDLLAIERNLRNEGRWTTGPATLFEVLRLVHREVPNCLVLRWILDPLAPHGLGQQVQRRLLTHLNESADLALSTNHLDRTTVVVEASRQDTRADLVMYGPAWTIVVEAKIWAGEQDRQGRRLEAHWPDASYVFLTRTGSQMRSSGAASWIPLSWGQLRGFIHDAMSEAGSPPTDEGAVARAAIHDYLTATRRLERT
jgi:hypothetical protein